MKTDIAYIYGLVDPRNNKIRYIGKTIHPKNRLSGHISECKNKKVIHHRAKWIRSILKLNLRPLIKFIKICPLDEFYKYESEYIKLYESNNLTNSDMSGSGNIGRRREIIDRQINKVSKIVYQYDLNGNFIKEYKSVRDASRNLGINHSNISRCCRGEYKHTYGFIFRYDNNLEIFSISSPNAIKKGVLEIDSYGNIIFGWVSIMECSRNTGISSGNISRVCSGKYKCTKGRYFIYKNTYHI